MNSRELLKQLYIGVAVTIAAFAVLGAIFMRPIWLYEVALLVGGAASCFMIYHMYDCLDRALDMQAKSARSFITIRVLFRLALRAGLLVGAIFIDWTAFVGVAVGLLAIKISAYINPAIRKKRLEAGYFTEDTPLGPALDEDVKAVTTIDRVEDALDIENNK